MIFRMLKNSCFLMVFFFLQMAILFAQEVKVIKIDTTQGHPIKIGASGFNVRIADKVWDYTHPDFIEVVKELKPGWLRYFSGTMGDAFCSATGQFDLDYICMFDDGKQYLKGHRFTEVKGPHRLTDLYQLLSEVNGKVIITVNAFTETPEMTLELARFCKNNNIKVEVWQFCNEPYFYVPNRNRYWWNDGYDYAAKMQPHANAIKQIFPDAKLALNYTWDGVWTFMKEITKFQKENGAYWNVFSKHSYAPHSGKKESLVEAYCRANTKLIEVTDASAMSEIENYTWKNVPMLITEFGVWNTPLNGIYSSVYNIEYVMRQLAHTNTQYVGAHEISSKYSPLNNKNEIIENAFKNRTKIDTDTIRTGISRDLEGKAYKIYHEATSNSDYLYGTTILNEAQVSGLNNTKADGMFAQTYKGINGYNYLVITNRSGETNQFQVNVNGSLLKDDLLTTYISADSLTTQNTNINEIDFKKGIINIKPYSLYVAKWKTKNNKLKQPTIYKATVGKEGVLLQWGAISNATSYKIYYGADPLNLTKNIIVNLKNSFLVNGLTLGKTYFFKVEAQNENRTSAQSESVVISYELPKKPRIFKVARRDDTVTLFWQSVPNATGYYINYSDLNGKKIVINANNVFGYRIQDLKDKAKYNFTVTAYNGLGNGIASEEENVLVSSNIPLSPRNISAIKKNSNAIEVKWFPQDKVLKNTTYTVYRGEKLHEFTKIASGVQDTIYVDSTMKPDKQYFYTVKAATEAGESNFYPNIATAFSLNNNNKITIQAIETQQDGYLVKVAFNVSNAKPIESYGVIINNVSYLNVEDLTILGDANNEIKNSFQIFIPKSRVKNNSNYAIKAFISSAGKKVESATVNQYIK